MTRTIIVYPPLSCLLFALLLTGCIPNPDSSLGTVPEPIELKSSNVEIGERLSPGFQSFGTWQADDLQISSDGHFTGTFTLYYGRQSVAVTDTHDILFIQPTATYISSPMYDRAQNYSGPLIPVFAQARSDISATFPVSFTFPLPPPMMQGQNGYPLEGLAMRMVWARIYQGGSGVPYSPTTNVYSSKSLNELATVRFDQPPQSARGQLTNADGYLMDSIYSLFDANPAPLATAMPAPSPVSPLATPAITK